MIIFSEPWRLVYSDEGSENYFPTKKVKTLMIVKFFMKRLFILCLASMLGFGISQAQEIWTLQKCIDKALENNLTIKKGQLVIASNQLTSQSNKEALLPSLSGFAGYNFSFGRNINPVNNTYVEQNVQSGQFGLSSSVTLFNGFQNINTIKLGKINEEVSRKDLEVIYNTVSLQVATQFLQILFNEETINTVKSTVSSTEKQLETANVLYTAGNTNQSNVLELEAKLASDKLDLVNAENNYRLSLLGLATLMQVPFDDNFKIESPAVNIPDEVILEGTQSIYEKASGIMPEIELSNLRYKSASMQRTISKGAYYPTLSMNANLSTLFSNNFNDFVNPRVVYLPSGYVQGTNETVLSPSLAYDGLVVRPFSNQINGNLGKSLGFNLSVPIYSNGRVRNAVKQAEISTEQQKLNIKQTQNELFTSVANAVANYSAAKTKYGALVTAAEAQKRSYEFNRLRFDAGALSSNDLVISQKNYESAQARLVQGKFDFIFRKVLLDFYRGKPLILK